MGLRALGDTAWLFKVGGTDPDKKLELKPDRNLPFVGMAFKIVEDPFGQLTFMRIYQGTIEKGGTYVNQRTARSERFSRIVRMHSDKREDDRAVGERKAWQIH